MPLHTKRNQATNRSVIPNDALPADIIRDTCADILAAPNMQLETQHIQHGNTTVLSHSAQVTAWSLIVARELNIPVDAQALTRGALLHDYFGYDWHVPGPENHLHGFTHPFIACRKALRDFNISSHEQSIIRTHMFPLVPLPPTSREALLVCLVDKTLALYETFVKH